MSWVMADRVGQSEHHYSAGFSPPPSPRIISAQQRDTLLNYSRLSVGIWGKATVGCGVKLHLMLKKIIMKESDCRDLHMST